MFLLLVVTLDAQADECWLPSPFTSFPFTSPTVRFHVPSRSEHALPIKFHAVVPYWNINIYSLMPVTVMVLLCVNTAATVCDSLCQLGCSPYWAVDVVCDARKPFWHVPPLVQVCYIIDNQLCQDELGFFLFAYHNRTPLGLTGNSLWEVLWNQGQYCDGAVYQ